MTQILHIDASAHIETGTSRKASAKIVSELGGNAIHRDVAANTLPFIDGAWADARLTDPDTRSAADAETLALSDTLVAELEAADTIVIGTPLYNFGVPASLKAWMDLVARPRKTFSYTPDGPVGHLAGKKAIVVVSSGGVPVGAPMNFLTPHLKLFLGFLGITDVDVRAASDVLDA